jgi:signal transduction histidine kinase
MPANDNNTRKVDYDNYRELATISQTCWWETDVVTRTFTFSDNISSVLGLDVRQLSFEQCLLYIRRDFRDLIRQEIFDSSFSRNDFYSRTYPLVTLRGEVWVKCDLGRHVFKNGKYSGSFGKLQVVPSVNSEIKVNVIRDAGRMLRNVSRVVWSLSDFLTDKDEDDIIKDILTCMLNYYSASEARITRLDEEEKRHICTHLVTDKTIKADDRNRSIANGDLSWCTKTISSNRSIICDSPDQLPLEALDEHLFLDRNNIKSFMLFPLASDKKVWGYVGIHTIGFSRHWSNEDYLWMLSMVNILNVCIELSRERSYNAVTLKDKENLINNLPIGYTRIKAIRNTQGEVTDYLLAEVNKTSSEMYIGNCEEEGKLGSEVHSKSLFDENISYLCDVLKNKMHIDNSLQVPSGQICRRISYESGKDEIVELNVDITNYKKVEHELIEARNKAQEMDRLKSAFLANMSHEIRTPLNAIVGFSELLIEADDIDKRREFYEILKRNNELLLQLINDILDLSKIEAGTMDFKFEDVDVNQFCADIAMSMRLKVSDTVKIRFIPSVPQCKLYTDVTRINQVISNFMNNAIKFTVKGSITLSYDWVDEEHIRFSVTDTGIGISEENRQKIFDRFVKLDSFAQGTGLGLSICRSIVEHLGGRIGVDSQKGKGSCFWFILPRDMAESNKFK